MWPPRRRHPSVQKPELAPTLQLGLGIPLLHHPRHRGEGVGEGNLQGQKRSEKDKQSPEGTNVRFVQIPSRRSMTGSGMKQPCI